MRLLVLRDHIHRRVREAGMNEDILSTFPTSTELQVLRAWERRLRAVGGSPAALIPPSGALEWASPANTVEPSDDGR
jgi:hypothetical protein